jgi:hypothetical protein
MVVAINYYYYYYYYYECIFGSGKLRGSGFWNRGYMSKGREMGRSVYEQPGNEVDGSCHSKEGSKLVRGDEWGAKGNRERGSKRTRGLLCNSL